MTNLRPRLVRLLLIAVAPILAAACDAGTPQKNELKFTTDSFSIRVSPESLPTRALEPTYWRVVIHDIKTGLPIQGGQGRIFATNPIATLPFRVLGSLIPTNTVFTDRLTGNHVLLILPVACLALTVVSAWMRSKKNALPLNEG